jgi:hypothetical protein
MSIYNHINGDLFHIKKIIYSINRWWIKQIISLSLVTKWKWLRDGD